MSLNFYIFMQNYYLFMQNILYLDYSEAVRVYMNMEFIQIVRNELLGCDCMRNSSGY